MICMNFEMRIMRHPGINQCVGSVNFMATIKEIAKKANVSIATVSNILNHKGGASEETVKKVMAVVREYHYTPNYNARSLKQQNTNTIGVITEDLTVFNTPEIVDGINSYCDDHHYHFILENLRLNKKYGIDFRETEEYAAILEDEIQVLLSKQVDGIIYVGCHCRELECIPREIRVPVVVAYSYADLSQVPSVVFDDNKAAYMATRYLLKNGHEKVGLIAGPMQSRHTQLRLLGYQLALYESEQLYNPMLVEHGDWGRESGYKAAKKLYARGVRAFFCMNDIMAGGVYQMASELGLSVGEDISVMGFDNREISEAYYPALSTVELPLFNIGSKAAELLIGILANKLKAEDNLLLQMECTLIPRASVKKIK